MPWTIPWVDDHVGPTHIVILNEIRDIFKAILEAELTLHMTLNLMRSELPKSNSKILELYRHIDRGNIGKILNHDL